MSERPDGVCVFVGSVCLQGDKEGEVAARGAKDKLCIQNSAQPGFWPALLLLRELGGFLKGLLIQRLEKLCLFIFRLSSEI